MDIVDRLIAYRNYTGYSNSQFADLAGIPRPTLSQFLNGRNKRLSDDLTGKLHQAYPDLNIMWLLFGEGDMVNAQNIKISEGKNDENQGLFGAQYTENTDIARCEITDKNSNDLSANRQKSDEFNPNLINTEHQPVHNEEFGHCDSSKAFAQQQSQKLTSSSSVPTDPAKKIQSIMVFYSDNSYEIFTPGSTEK